MPVAVAVNLHLGTTDVVAACKSLHRGREGKISGNVIENNLGSAEYSMIITDRKKAKDSDGPEGGTSGLQQTIPQSGPRSMPKDGG